MLHVVYIKCSQLITYIWLIALFLCISFPIHGKSGEDDLFMSLIQLLKADYCTSYENQTFAVPFANLNCQISWRGQGPREGETIQTPRQPVSHHMWSTAAAWEHLLPSHNILTFLLRSSYPLFLLHPFSFHFDVLTSNLNHYCDETRGCHRHDWSFPLEAVIRGAQTRARFRVVATHVSLRAWVCVCELGDLNSCHRTKRLGIAS